jgi:sec-independent protein translocase protein TatA
MGALQPWHLILILAIVVLLFGGAKIPELMRGVGKGMGEFKKGMEEMKKPPDEDPAPKLEEKKTDEPAAKP